MAETVNSQVTDALTVTYVSVLGESPAQSMGLVYQTMGQSIGLTMQNAVTAQNGMQQIKTAVISAACTGIMGLTKQEKNKQQQGSSTPANSRKAKKIETTVIVETVQRNPEQPDTEPNKNPEKSPGSGEWEEPENGPDPGGGEEPEIGPEY